MVLGYVLSAYPFLLSVGGEGVYIERCISPTKCLFLPGIFKKACPAASLKNYEIYKKAVLLYEYWAIQDKKIARYKKTVQELEQELSRMPTDNEIADRMGVFVRLLSELPP